MRALRPFWAVKHFCGGRADSGVGGEFFYGLVGQGSEGAGGDEGGGDFGQGDEDEGALVHAGVGDGQARGLDALLAVEEEVEVEGARGVGPGALAAFALFDLQQVFEQGQVSYLS